MNPIMWLDDIGKPAWIALMIVSFILFWPMGLVVLGLSDRERTNGMLDIAARRRSWRTRLRACRSGRRDGAARASGRAARHAHQRQPRL